MNTNDNDEIRALLNRALDKQFQKGLDKHGQGVDVQQEGMDWIEEAVERLWMGVSRGQTPPTKKNSKQIIYFFNQ